MKNVVFLAVVLIGLAACNKNDFEGESDIVIPIFNFPKTVEFKAHLSEYEVFQGEITELVPNEEWELLELSSVLFTDYAHKQRLVKIPAGSQITKQENGTLVFPDHTLLTKTFFYYLDERDTSKGKKIIETRLLIKEAGTWNAATYVWNETQTEAILQLDGAEMAVSWINASGSPENINYVVPKENDCMACHQVNAKMAPIGPSLLNLNREVDRNGASVNQLNYLQSRGKLNSFATGSLPKMVDYKDPALPLAERGRAYLAINCAHCHNPSGWSATQERDFDFRHHLPTTETGIPFGKDKIQNAMLSGKMPLIGTTIPDDQGIALISAYVKSLP